jgi:hypothetical protein
MLRSKRFLVDRQRALYERQGHPFRRHTAAARAGVGNLRSGQKKACGAVEQKKEPKQARKSARKSVSKKKVLAFGVAIRERKNARSAGRTKEWTYLPAMLDQTTTFRPT